MGVIYNYASLRRHGLPTASQLEQAARDLVSACDRLSQVSSVVVVGSVAEGQHNQWSDIDAIVWATQPAACWEVLMPMLGVTVPHEAYEVKVWPTEETLEVRTLRFSDLGFAQVLLDGFATGRLCAGRADEHTRSIADQFRTDVALRRRCVADYLQRRVSVADRVASGKVRWSRHETRRLLETPKAVQRQLARISDAMAGDLAYLEFKAFDEITARWADISGAQLRAVQGSLSLEKYTAMLREITPQIAKTSAQICRRAAVMARA